MDDASFFRLACAGHGRAGLWVHERGFRPSMEVMTDLLLHCHSAEPENGTLAAFVYDLFTGLPERDQLRRTLLDSLTVGDDWDTAHRFHLTALLVTDGDAEARAALLNAFVPGPRFGAHLACSVIMALGEEGLLLAASRLGAHPEARWPLSNGIERFGEERVRKLLGDAAVADENIAVFLRADEEKRNAPITRTKKRTPVTDLEELLIARKSEDPKTAWRVWLDLSDLKHDVVRALALEMVERRDRDRRHAAAMIESNFRPGDHRMLLDWYQAESDPEVLHGWTMSLRRVWESHPDETTESEFLRLSYELSPCATCRGFVVERMAERGEITDEMRAEFKYDNDETIADRTESCGDRPDPQS